MTFTDVNVDAHAYDAYGRKIVKNRPPVQSGTDHVTLDW